MNLDLDQLSFLQQEGLVKLVKDPETGLNLANYTPKAQYGRYFDAHPLLLDCRGIIYDDTGLVRAKPFHKFYNVDEHPSTKMDVLTTYEIPEITHKIDGSMITVAMYEGRVIVATRGSFLSTQAQEAKTILRRDLILDPLCTYVFELTSPTNRIVVDYGTDPQLTLIGLVRTRDGREQGQSLVLGEAYRIGVHAARVQILWYQGHDIEWPALKDIVRSNFEGYVLNWPKRQLKAKIKLADYLRIHRLVSGINEHWVWERLRVGTNPTLGLEGVSEEIRMWVDDTSHNLDAGYSSLLTSVQGAITEIARLGLRPDDPQDRRQIAAAITTHVRRPLHAAVWMALDGKDPSSLLWKQLEPKHTPPISGL